LGSAAFYFEAMMAKKAKREPGFPDRIVRFERRPASEFLAHPENWRQHPEMQRTALRNLLENIGWAGAVTVNETTGHVINGHERIWQAMHAGDALVPVLFVKVTEEEERILLISMDSIGEMAITEQDKLSSLLASVTPANDEIRDLLTLIAQEPKILVTATSAFTPNVVPQIGNRVVTAEDVYTTKGELDKGYTPGRPLLEVLCPHCKREYFIDPSNIS